MNENPRIMPVTFDWDNPPYEGATVQGPSSTQVRVRIMDTGGNQSYHAKISDIGGDYMWTNLDREGSTAYWSADVDTAGDLPPSPPSTDNKQVTVEGFSDPNLTYKTEGPITIKFKGYY